MKGVLRLPTDQRWLDLKPKWRKTCFIDAFGKSIEPLYLWIWKSFDKVNWISWAVFCELVLHHIVLNCALDICYFRHTDDDLHWGLSCFHWKFLPQIKTVYQCTKCSLHQKREYLHHFVILTFFIVVFANTIGRLRLVMQDPMKSLLSVCPSVPKIGTCPSMGRSVHWSLSFLKIASLAFSDIVDHDSWPWYLVTTKPDLKKKNWQVKFGQNGPNVFCYFLKFGSLVFLEITYNDSVQ